MRARLVPAAATAAATAGIVAALLGTGPAVAGGNPAGNNGTIKVAEVDQVGTESNDPHVACTFALEWYDFDALARSTVTFESIAPTKSAVLGVARGPLSVTMENDAAKGGTDLDAREIYTLAFTGDPQPNQGFHVNVTTNTTGSQGNDSKSKTFWVGPCATAAPDPGTGTTDPGTGTGTTGPGTGTGSGTTDPGTGTTDPGTEDPGTEDPGTEDPGTGDPGTGDPGTGDPGTGTTDPGAPFDWDWTYDDPGCAGLTVDYPADIPSGQANDVNVRLETPAGQRTLNFHNNTGTWSGTTSFPFTAHRDWPTGLADYDVTWVQVGGTNYHWQGDVACRTDGDPTTPDVPQAVTDVSGFRAGTVTVRRGSTVAPDPVAIEQAGTEALTLEQYTGGTWQVARTVAASARGTARVTYPRFTHKGTYRFRLTVSRSLTTTGDTTSPLTVRVR